jgi:hypothetical protein
MYRRLTDAGSAMAAEPVLLPAASTLANGARSKDRKDEAGEVAAGFRLDRRDTPRRRQKWPGSSMSRSGMMKSGVLKLASGLGSAILLTAASTAMAQGREDDELKPSTTGAARLAAEGAADTMIASSRWWGRADDDDYDYDGRYGYRKAVTRCTDKARERGLRYGKARISEITHIERVRRGYRVEGRIRIDKGAGGDWDDQDRGARREHGTFFCQTRQDSIRWLDLYGLDH